MFKLDQLDQAGTPQPAADLGQQAADLVSRTCGLAGGVVVANPATFECYRHRRGLADRRTCHDLTYYGHSPATRHDWDAYGECGCDCHGDEDSDEQPIDDGAVA